MNRAVSVSIYLDDLPALEPRQGHHGVGRPFLFLGTRNLDLWGHEPAAFRRLAEALVAAADLLDAAQPPQPEATAATS